METSKGRLIEMRLEQLYIFQKIAETGSIRKASATLYTTPQNVSKAMIQLEEEWNTTLYLRSRTGVRLTQEGEQAYELIQKILEDIDALNQYFHVSGSNYFSDVRLPVSITSCSLLEPFATGAVNTLLADYEKTPIQIDKKGSVQIRSYLFALNKEEEMPDLVLTNEIPEKMALFQKKTEKYYDCYFLFEDELCLQVPKNDPLANYDRIPLSVLEDLPMLLYTGTPAQKTESELIIQSRGHELKNVSRTANIETCSQIALNRHKYCFVGYPSVEFRPMANIDYIPLEQPITTNQILLVKKKRKNKSFTNAFIKSIDDSFNIKKIW